MIGLEASSKINKGLHIWITRFARNPFRLIGATAFLRSPHGTWHSLRHRFAQFMIDVHKATPGHLMALGGWENEMTVKNRYYKTGKEHEDGGRDLFEHE